MSTWRGGEIFEPDRIDSLLKLRGQGVQGLPDEWSYPGPWEDAAPDYTPRPGQKNYLSRDQMAQGGQNALALPPFSPPQVGTYGLRNAMPEGDLQNPLYTAGRRSPMGQMQGGNVNLNTRPNVFNPAAGGYSSVYSMSFEDGGQHVLVPLVTDAGTIDTPDQAVARYRQTGRHLGVFATPELADAYADKLHVQQENALARGPR